VTHPKLQPDALTSDPFVGYIIAKLELRLKEAVASDGARLGARYKDVIKLLALNFFVQQFFCNI
jgi:hypothetical protein